MICLLCLCVERDEHLIDITSAESRRHNLACILYTHFAFCFQEEPNEGFICQKCWVKVSVFHEFYTHIENVHRSKESIFVECIVDDIKPTFDSDSDKWEMETPPELAAIDEKPKNLPKRRRGRPRKRRQTSSDHSESDCANASANASHFDEKIENNGAIKVKSESISTVHLPTEPKKKKARKRKDDSVVVTREENYMCDKCPLGFRTPRNLERHAKLVHDVLKFKCNYIKCVESYATEEERDIHYNTMHKQKECPHCKKMILLKFIDQHINEQHNARNEIICHICGRVSATKLKHQSHFRKVHQVHVPLQCDICKRWLKHKDALKGHMLRHVQGPQKCLVCDHISPNRKALAKHKQTHDLQRKERFRCPTCGKCCRDKMSLQEHSHIHTGFAGRYNCEECGKIFRFSSSFCLHKKKMHPK